MNKLGSTATLTVIEMLLGPSGDEFGHSLFDRTRQANDYTGG